MFDAYKIAVRLVLSDGVTPGIVGLAGQFVGLNRHINGTQQGLSLIEARLAAIKRLGIVGGAILGAGVFGIHLFKAPLEEAKQFQNEVARFTALGLGDKATQDAVKFAKGMEIIGNSARDNMRMLREATGITGSFEHAREITPLLLKMRFGIESVMGEDKAANFEKMFQASIKVAELRGALIDRKTGQVSPHEFERVLNLMTQAYVASGGLVKPQDYLAAIKTGGVSTKLMQDEAFFFGLGHFMQESGGARTGTASMSMFQNWAMGRVSQQVAENLSKLGLLQKDHVHYGKTGHITKVDPMSMVQADRFVQNPFQYVNEVIVPVLRKQGFEGDKLNIKLASLLGIRTAANLVDQFVREQKVAQTYIERARRAGNVDTLAKIGGQTLEGRELEMQARWRDALRELGDAVLPMAIRVVKAMTEAVKDFTHFAREHPTLVKGIAFAFIGLSAALAFGGTVLLLTAAFKGLALALSFASLGGPGGIARIATAVGTFGGAIWGLGVVIAATVGLLAGTWAKNKMDQLTAGLTGQKGETFGGWLHDVLHGQTAPPRGSVKLTAEAQRRITAGDTGLKIVGTDAQRQYWASLGMPVPGVNRPWKDAPALDHPAGTAAAGAPWSGAPSRDYVPPQAGNNAAAGPAAEPKAPSMVQVQSVIKLDSRTIATAVTEHQARDASRPFASTTDFDSTFFPAPVGMR